MRQFAASLSVACGGSARTSGDHNVGAGASGGEGAIGGSDSTGAQAGSGGTGSAGVAGASGGKVVPLTPGSWQMTGVVTEPQVNPGFMDCPQLVFTLNVTPDGSGYLATIGQDGFMDSTTAEIKSGSYVLGGLYLPCGNRLTVSGLTLQGTDVNGDGKADQLSGSGSGMIYSGGGDIALGESVEIALTRVPDVTAPTLKVPTEALDPFAVFNFAASEPLLPTASLTLVGTSTVPLSAERANGLFLRAPIDDVIKWSASEFLILPLAGQWTVQGSGEDPSGHALDLSGMLRTMADPGVFSQDGFEGPLNAAILSGAPSIVTGLGNLPVISGAHSFWIGPDDSVLFHLRRAAAEQTLHFLARSFSQSGAPIFNANFVGGVVGAAQPGSLWTTTPTLPNDPVATGDSTWQQASAVTQFSMPLTDAGSDVLLHFSWSALCRPYAPCALPSALMIDDLTLE